MLKNTMFKNITYDEIQTLIKAKAKCLPVRDYTHNEMQRINYVMDMLVRSFIVYGPVRGVLGLHECLPMAGNTSKKGSIVGLLDLSHH